MMYPVTCYNYYQPVNPRSFPSTTLADRVLLYPPFFISFLTTLVLVLNLTVPSDVPSIIRGAGV